MPHRHQHTMHNANAFACITHRITSIESIASAHTAHIPPYRAIILTAAALAKFTFREASTKMMNDRRSPAPAGLSLLPAYYSCAPPRSWWPRFFRECPLYYDVHFHRSETGQVKIAGWYIFHAGFGSDRRRTRRTVMLSKGMLVRNWVDARISFDHWSLLEIGARFFLSFPLHFFRSFKKNFSIGKSRKWSTCSLRNSFQNSPWDTLSFFLGNSFKGCYKYMLVFLHIFLHTFLKKFLQKYWMFFQKFLYESFSEYSSTEFL